MPENTAIFRHGNREMPGERRWYGHSSRRFLRRARFAENDVGGKIFATIEPLDARGAVLAELAEPSAPRGAGYSPGTERAYAQHRVKLGVERTRRDGSHW